MKINQLIGFSIGPIGSAALGLITLPAIAWFFTAEDVGRLAMLQVATGFSVLLFSLGMDQAYARSFHESQDKASLLKAAFSPGFLALLLFLSGVLVGPWSLSLWLFGVESFLMTVLVCASIFSVFCTRFLSLMLRMQERGLAFSISFILPHLFLLLIIISYIYLSVPAQFGALLWAKSVSIILVFALYAWNTRKGWMPALCSIIDRKQQAQLFSYGWPLIGSGIAFWGLTAMDKVFLRNFASFEALGVYSIAVNFAGVALVLQSIFSTVWAPTVYKWASGNINLAKVKKVMNFVTFFVIMLWSVTGMLSWLVPYFLPADYQTVQYIMLAVMGQPLLYTLSESTGIGISIQRRTLFALVASLSALLVNGIGNWFLIPLYGASGAAIALVWAFFVFFAIRTEISARVWIGFERWRAYGLVISCMVLSIAQNLWTLPLSITCLLYFGIAVCNAFCFRSEIRLLIDYLFNKLRRSD